MRLTAEQRARYERDGYLIFPNLIGADEIGLLKRELDRVGEIHDPRVVRERTGGPRIVYGMHEPTGPTASRAYEALVRSSRILEPVQDLLGEDVFVYHTKCNTKAALGGAIYEWHQDYTNWNIMDGTPNHKILTAAVLFDKATEVGGCLYFIPGSHREGIVKPDVSQDELQARIRRVAERGEPMPVPPEKMADIVGRYGEPVAVTGEPGAVVIFHGDMVHGSGHNMSVHSRWILYIVYSAVSNRPGWVPKPREEFQASRHAEAATVLDAPSILEAVR
ncbi:MAG TPA: phytanoyl-CoA dioxygenase family protein [Alphaproteobacteria bacterium]|nr:phytanoyl-CoA dioxygenase family protein [Alphaproteobacteria bacterium]